MNEQPSQHTSREQPLAPLPSPTTGHARAGARRLLLMRGLPSCGKSTRARELAAQGGLCIEFDVPTEPQASAPGEPRENSTAALERTSQRALERALGAVDRGLATIVLDGEVSCDWHWFACVSYALRAGYEVRIEEAGAPWWPPIRRLLSDKASNRTALVRWAHKLSYLGKPTGAAAVERFLAAIDAWQSELNVTHILAAGDANSWPVPRAEAARAATRNADTPGS